MKTRLSTFLFGGLMLLGSASIAQPTITANGVNPQLGESFMIYNGSYLSPGSAGANQTWDYTALAGSQGESYTFVTTGSTTHASSFPNSTLAFTNSGGSTIRYYLPTSSAQENHGSFGSTVTIPFTDAEDLLRFPFTHGNSYSDTWSGVYTTSYTIYRRGTTTVTADAYGTMVTPAGSFANCVRVHFVQAYQDSFNFGSPFIYTFDNDEYMWYQEGFHTPVAITTILTSSSGLNFSAAGYYTSGPVAIAPAMGSVNSAEVYPNPASDHATLALDLRANGSVEVQIFNGVGQLVQTLAPRALERGLNELVMAVDLLPNGVYYAKVVAGGKLASTKRFVVAR